MNQNGDKQGRPVLGAADWISLAAAPSFAIMALLTGIHGGACPTYFARPRKMHRR